MEEKKKIGIIGGTFDPIHYGHLLIAENAYEQFGLDKVYFMPTGNSPHKDNKTITDAEVRAEMIDLAIRDNPHLALSRMEVEDPEVSYTYRTMEKLHKTHPEYEIYFILGGDSIAYFKDWVHPEIICKYAKILVAARDLVEAESLRKYADDVATAFSTDVFIINTPLFDVSSHEIRQRFAQGGSVKYMLPEELIRYIGERHLYERI